MRKRLLIIYNPSAGGARRDLFARVIDRLAASGALITISQAACYRTGRALAREAAESGAYDIIVAAGGDGTIRSAAAGLLGSTVPLGIIPLGTGNVMAHELGLGRRTRAITECLLEGRSVPFVAGLANREPFFCMASVGFDAAAVAWLSLRLKRYLGKLAYVPPVLRALMRPLPKLTVEINGVAYTACWAIITRTSHYAGGFSLVPGTAFERGLCAVLCHTRTRTGLISAMLAIGLGRAGRAANLTILPCKEAHITAPSPVPVQLDGEPFAFTPLKISQDRRAVALVVPRPIWEKYRRDHPGADGLSDEPPAAPPLAAEAPSPRRRRAALR